MVNRAWLVGISLLLAGPLLAGCQAVGIAPSGGVDGSSSMAKVSTDRRLYLSVIAGLQASGQPHAAIAYLDDYDRLYPNDPSAQALRGEALVAIGDIEKAGSLFSELLRQGYGAQGNAGMGKVRAGQGQWEQAAWYFGKAVTFDPANPTLLNNLGYALLKAYRAGEAYYPLAQAMELDPKSTEIRNNLLLAEYWGGRREAAAQRINRIENANEREAVQKFVISWSAAGDGSSVSAR